MKLNKITVLYNLPVSESVDDLDTQNEAYLIVKTLNELGYSADVLGIGTNEVYKVKTISADLVFNLIEWTAENAKYCVEALKILERKGIPYTGSAGKGYLLTCNKILMKKYMSKNDVPTPKWMYFVSGDEKISKSLPYPMIVKPSMQHCGIGVTQESVVTNEEDLRKQVKLQLETYNEPILAEEYIEGRELHVTVLEKNGRPWVLPPAEVTFEQNEGYRSILSYNMKWDENSAEYTMAGDMAIPQLDGKMLKEIEEIAKRSYLKLGGGDYPRLDLRVRDGKVYVLEINNNPGIDFTNDSGIGASARASGFTTYSQLLQHIVENAFARWRYIYDAVVA